MVIILFVTLALGTVEFGRAWMISNMITHAAGTGARMAAVQASNRNGACQFTDTSAIKGEVRSEIQTVVPTLAPSIVVTQLPGGVPLVQVTVDATVPYLFNLFGPTFRVLRSVTFRDEGC